MIFYLGTHRPHWLGLADAPLFISRRQLARYAVPPKAIGPFAVDSGRFTECWRGEPPVPVRQYIREVCRWIDLGDLQWAAAQDWMCEPVILAKTGLTVLEHQKRTVANYLELMDLCRWEAPFVPVLQGWHPDDYLRCLEMYAEAGVDLAALPLVGVGSVCRRQKTEEAMEILRPLHALGLKLHGFGFKIDGLYRGASHLLASSDSMAWSAVARREKIKLPGCTHKGPCNNCRVWAMRWREKVLKAAAHGEREYQEVLFT